jgi:hypothetical protein
MNSIKEPKPKNQERATNRLQTLLVFTRFEVLFRVVHYSYIENLLSAREDSCEEFDVLCCGELYKFTVREETFEATFLACGSQLKVGTLLVVNI